MSNDYLAIRERRLAYSVQLRVRILRAKPYEVAVRKYPRIGSEQVGGLPAESTAIAVGVSTDATWLQVVQPVAGWVAANDVADLGSP